MNTGIWSAASAREALRKEIECKLRAEATEKQTELLKSATPKQREQILADIEVWVKWRLSLTKTPPRYEGGVGGGIIH